MVFRRARRCATLSLLLLSCQASAQSRFIVQPKQTAKIPTQQDVSDPSVALQVSNSSKLDSKAGGEPGINSMLEQSPFGGEAIQWVKRGSIRQQRSQAFATSESQESSSRASRVGIQGFPAKRKTDATSTITQVGKSVRNFAADIPTVSSPVGRTFMPNAIPNREPASGQQESSQKQQVAQTVSSQIIASQPKPARDAGQLIPLNRSVGWDAIGDRLVQKGERCNHLLMRNAFFSARQEAQESIVELVRALDKVENRFHCEPALIAAQQAIKEAEDFEAQQRTTGDTGMLRRIVDSHQTPILKRQNLVNVPPLAAAEHYRLYALQSLLEAAQGHPWASEVYYLIGRTFHAQADNSDGNPQLLRERAAVYYQAATKIRPDNALASNQLGYILLQKGQTVEAKQALVASVESGATPESLANLVEASRRLGDMQLMQWAAANHNAMQPPQQGPRIPEVVEVDARRFAAMSPKAAGPQPVAR